ncbi:MAG TPA: hypothetical protein VHG29_09620 [Novosphingobium sp.]|nr:hypothetical protein [Novosphingobium sp.]
MPADPALRRTFGFGQMIDSAIAIPGTIAVPTDIPPGPPLTVAGRAASPPGPGDLYRIEHGIFVYSLAGVASFRCTPGSIALAAPTNADPALIAELLVANALPAVLWQQGSFVLHASAVVLDEDVGAIAIVGPAGSGKSSVAAALLDHGALLVGDDSLRIDCEATGATVSGLSGGLFDAIVPGEQRRFRPVTPDCAVPSARLLGIAVLDERAASFRLDRVARLRAVELLLAHRHRPGIPALLGMRQSVVAQATAIARSVPVALWHRRTGDLTISTGEVDALRRCFATSG